MQVRKKEQVSNNNDDNNRCGHNLSHMGHGLCCKCYVVLTVGLFHLLISNF